MPTKHTRKTQNANDFNLAPTTSAQPLAAYTKTGSKKANSKLAPKRGTAKAKPKPASDLKPRRGGKAIVEGYGVDDTPRAFQRLIEQQTNKRHLSGLDDGEDRRAKKPKTASKTAKDAEAQAADIPKIQPGERMSDYNARVDQAIKVSGLIQKGKAVEGIKERRTKKEKQMHKLYATWREEEAKIQEQKEEAREKQEELEEENAAKYGEEVNTLFKGKRSRAIGESNDKEGDIWAELKLKRGQKAKINDVVQAPPELIKVREKFKPIRGAKVDVANVPVASGSLKKREELGDARREVIERYRAMMREQRGDGL